MKHSFLAWDPWFWVFSEPGKPLCPKWRLIDVPPMKSFKKPAYISGIHLLILLLVHSNLYHIHIYYIYIHILYTLYIHTVVCIQVYTCVKMIGHLKNPPTYLLSSGSFHPMDPMVLEYSAGPARCRNGLIDKWLTINYKPILFSLQVLDCTSCKWR